MVKKTIILYAKNILDSIQSIKELKWSLSSTEAVENRLIFLSVLSLLVHIGETVSIITKNYPKEHISNARNIIDFRNILAHDYMTIRKWFIKKILDTSLDILEQDCKLILHHQWEDNYQPEFIEFAD